MKSERAGRLARDSAEILVGDRPGEFMVVTQEGSSIPVDVRDLTESAPGNMEPLALPAASPEMPASASATTAADPAAAAAPAAAAVRLREQASAQAQADSEPPGGSGPAPEAGSDQGAAVKKSTWLGSMMAAGTAALGLKGGAPANGGSTRSVQPAEIPAASAAAAPYAAEASAAPAVGKEAAPARDATATEALEQPPVLNIASTEPKADPSPVSAFASEVAVQPVSAATTDSSPIEGMTSSPLLPLFMPLAM